MKTEKLHIAGKVWTVEFVDPAPVIDGEISSGTADTSSWTIRVWDRHPDLFSVLYHEIDHAVINAAVNTHPSDEEACTQAHETGWVSIIRDPRNTWFVRRIAKAASLELKEAVRTTKRK